MSLFYDIKDPKSTLEFTDFGNFPCFFLCEKGSVIVLLNNRIYNLHRNSIGIIPPFSSLRIIKMSDDLEGWIAKIDREDLTDAVLGLPEGRKMEIQNEPCRYIGEIQRRRISDIKRIIEDRSSAADETGYFMINNIIRSLKKAFCYEITQSFVSGKEYEETKSDRTSRIFYAFLESVKQKFASEKNISYYAAEQNLSPAYFSAIIKDFSGQPAKFWIENMTYFSAVNYLRNPSFSISKIAWILNFPDQSSFGKYFKKISGHSPAGFRKKYL